MVGSVAEGGDNLIFNGLIISLKPLFCPVQEIKCHSFSWQNLYCCLYPGEVVFGDIELLSVDIEMSIFPTSSGQD